MPLESWLMTGGAICFAVLQTFAFSTNSAVAQITPDGTLPNNSSVKLEGNTRIIEGGTQAGSNLFHSFSEFSVPNGSTAYFNNALDIQNIISRVTGKSVSNIDGLIRANGTANLFLINPNGIIFGPNASLDVRGSFVATTANAIEFGNQGFFSATNPNTPALLTVNPSAFLFNQIAAQPITINSRRVIGFRPFLPDYEEELVPVYEGLRVPNGQSLLLVGGNVSLDDGVLQAPGGQVELGGASGSGKIGLNVDGNNLRLSFPDNVERADVSFTNGALVDVIAGDGGSITINARNLDILGNSELTAGIGEGLGTVDSQAGDIMLNATRAITIGQSSEIRMTSIKNEVGFYATGNGGDINIKAGSPLVIDSAVLSTISYGQGNSGSVSVQVDGNGSFANTFIGSDAVRGKAGSVLVHADGDVSFANSIISSSSFGKGVAGSILVQANGNISFAKTYISSATLGTNDTGRGIPEQGNAGSISVQANGDISFADSLIASYTTGEGDAGSVSVRANGDVSFTGYSRISSNTAGEGNAGSVSLRANGDISFADNTQIDSYTTGEGDAGSVSLQANGDISFADSLIASYTAGEGNAGSVSLQTNGGIYFTNSFIYSTVEPGGEGKGGDIQIRARSLSLSDGAEFLATTRGNGNAGNIQVDAVDSVTLSGVIVSGFSRGLFTNIDEGASGQNINPASGIFNGDFRLSENIERGFSSGLFTNTESGASGKGGNITVRTGVLRILDGAVLSARTISDFDGGNITVNANNLEIRGGGQMLTTTFSSGNAGSITVNATDSINISGNDPTYSRRLAEIGRPTVDPASDASGLFSNTNLGSTGNGGNIDIRAGKLLVQDSAQVNVSSEGTGNAGSLRVEANLIKLDNQGKLLASTASGEGGNIDLQVRDLILMRRQSLISAQADNNGNGGNITINAPFVVAVPSEDSDIVANAFRGRGGNINITTSGIYGFEYRPQRTELSNINASSDFGIDGTIQINTPGIDPSQGLINLPTEPVEPKVASGCTALSSQNQSRFVVTGRGGLPANPREAFNSDTVRVDWVTLNPSSDNRHRQTVTKNPTLPTPAPIVEATGWVINDKGEVLLTASPPTGTPHSSWQRPTTCGAPKSASER